MKIRKSNKFGKMGCSHDRSFCFKVTDDPHTMYDWIFRCSLKGISIGSPQVYEEELPCEKCQNFTVAKKKIAWYYRYHKVRKREIKLENKSNDRTK